MDTTANTVHRKPWNKASWSAKRLRSSSRTSGPCASGYRWTVASANWRCSTSVSTASCAAVTLSASRCGMCVTAIRWHRAPSLCSTRPSVRSSLKSRLPPVTPCRRGSNSLGGSRKTFPFPSRLNDSPHLGTRQYARIFGHWVDELGLDRADYGTHSMRRTNATLIYRRTKNLRAVQLLRGHSKLESTVRYLGIEVDAALEISEQTEI